MSDQFIFPNWHVVLIHYPLGLVTIGVLIEVLSFLWPRSSVRTAGRWMILIGALACVPTITAGLYAFRNTVQTAPLHENPTWHEVMRTSNWTADQWYYMLHHIWFAAGGSVLLVIGSVVWLACSDRLRDTLYWPALIVVLAGVGLIGVGAWYSGESVYRQGTAVALRQQTAPNVTAARELGQPTTRPAAAPAVREEAAATGAREEEREEHQSRVEYFIPSLQLHVVLAGLAVAFGLGGVGAAIRRWAALAPAVAAEPERLPPGRLSEVRPVVAQNVPEQPVVAPGRRVAPWFWLVAGLLAIGTAAAGVWMNRDWGKLDALLKPLQDPAARAAELRLFVHVLFGLSIVLLTLLLALITGVAWRARGTIIVLIVLVLLAVAGQVCLGTLMLLDAPEGPLFGLRP